MSKIKGKTAEELLQEALVPEEEQRYKVPSNWRWVRLGSVCEVVGGGTPKSSLSEYFEDGDIPWVTPADLSGYTEMFIGRGKRNITELGLKNSSARLMPEGTVLLSSRAPIGYVAIASNEISTNQGFKSFLPSKYVDSKYLYWYLKLSTNYIDSLASGTTFREISGSKCKEIQIPLAPIDEQRRIADKVEILLNKTNQAKQLIEEAKESFELRRAAILDKAFRGELAAKWREEKGLGFAWEEFEIRNLVSELNQGWSPKCESYPSLEIEKWGVIKTTAIQHMDFNEDENKQLPDHLQPREQHELKTGDLLITRAGPRVRVGVCCLVKQVRPKLLLCDKAYRFRANLERVIPDYLVLALNSPMILKEINSMKTGISDSGVNLTQDKFLSIKLVVPAIAEQKEIIRQVDKLFSMEQKTQELLYLTEGIDSVKESILNSAFCGELGTNELTDDSAKSY